MGVCVRVRGCVCERERERVRVALQGKRHGSILGVKVMCLLLSALSYKTESQNTLRVKQKTTKRKPKMCHEKQIHVRQLLNCKEQCVTLDVLVQKIVVWQNEKLHTSAVRIRPNGCQLDCQD